MKRKTNKIMIIFTILNFVFTILCLFYCIKLNVVPLKYLIVVICFYNVLDIGGLLLLRKKKTKWVGIFLSVLIILFSILGTYYLMKTDDFLNNSFSEGESYHTNTYYVFTLKENKIDFSNSKIGYYENAPSMEEALIKVQSEVTSQMVPYDNLYNLFRDLKKQKIDAVLIEKSLYNFMLESDTSFQTSNYTLLTQIDIKIKEEQEEIDTANESFNIYIGGTDFTELYTDFNMIVTINKTTNQVLLTSTPRDFYLPISGKNGAKDLLGYAGVWGVHTSRKTLENLYDVDINYYIKINTKSLVSLVDTLGGIEFCSDISFTTTHATVMGTYDDETGDKLYVSKGCKKYNGIQILTIARERKAYADGDRQRQKNCQAIMISIFNKMASPELVTNYSNILNAVSSLYQTNIPKDLVTELARLTIDGAKWKIEQQSVTGSNSRGYVHFSDVLDYVMIPNNDSVKSASSKIKMIMAGK